MGTSSSFFSDVLVRTPGYPLLEAPELPQNLLGAVLFDGEAKMRSDECHRWYPKLWWQHAAPMDGIVGESNARFPSRAAQVIDLVISRERGPAPFDPASKAVEIPRIGAASCLLMCRAELSPWSAVPLTN